MRSRTTSKKGLAQWLGYSSMAAALFAIGSKADAQVVYTDLDPDVVLLNNHLNIDLDNDGIVDMKIDHADVVFTSHTYWSHFLNASIRLYNGSVVGSTGGWVNYAFHLGVGAPVAPSGTNFQEANYTEVALYRHTSSEGGTWFGDWSGDDGYVGFRFVAGDNELRYGWLHLAVHGAADSVKVFEYGYESLPNVGINVGETGLGAGLSNPKANIMNIEISPNPANDHALIQFPYTGQGKMEFSVIDATGQILQTNKLGNADNYTLNLAGFAPGVYIVRLQDEKKVAYRKFIKR
ncbi:MAG: T9SS type A sorting domain-containing protein [Flavobacteriales bacterium]